MMLWGEEKPSKTRTKKHVLFMENNTIWGQKWCNFVNTDGQFCQHELKLREMEIERMVKRSMSMLHKEQWDAVPHLTFTYQSHSTFLNHKSRRKGSKDSRDLEWQAICINTLMNPTFYECIANTAKHHACVKKTISSMLV